MTTLPSLRVEIDASTNPTAWGTPAAWTRIDGTNGVQSFRLTRGQQDTYGPVEPGELVLTLSNSNGFLDPSYSASPYADLLTTGRQLRLVHVKADASTQVIFRGNVEAWPVNFTKSLTDASTELVVRDFLALLGTSRLPASVVEYELARGVKYPRPSSVYPMNEEAGFSGTSISDTVGGWSGSPIGNPARAGDLVPFVEGNYGHQAGGITRTLSLPNGAFAYNSPPWSVMVMTRIREGGNLRTVLRDDPVSNVVLLCDVVGADTVVGGLVTDSTGVRRFDGAHKMDDDTARPLMWTDDGSTLRAYGGQGTFTGSVTHGALTAVPSGDRWELGRGNSAEFGLLIIWNGVLITAGQMNTIHNDIVFPWSGDFTDQRLTKLLDIVAPGIAKSYLLGVNAVTCLPVTLGNYPSLRPIRHLVEGADGRCWVDRTGTLQYAHRQTSAPGAALRTYGAAGTAGVPVRRVAVTDAREDVVNHCLVANEVGTKVAFHDTGASKKQGEHRLELIESPLNSPSAMWHLAERTVHYRKAPKPYVNELVISPSHTGVGYDDTLALDLYNRVDAAYVRPWDGQVVTSQGEVIGIEHVCQAKGGAEFTTRLRLRPPRKQRLRMSVPSSTGGAETPDTALNSITGNLDIRARFYRNNWRGTGFPMLVGKWFQNSAYVLHFIDDRPRLEWTQANGINGVVTGPPLRRQGVRPLWLRATLYLGTSSTDPLVASIYVSDDGADWRLWHRVTGSGPTSVRDTAAPVTVGFEYDTGGLAAQPLDGRILRTEVRNGIDGPLVSVFDPTEAGVGTAATTWTSSVGETWTVRTGSRPLEAW